MDFAKAFGLGAAALALNMLSLVVIVFVYSQLVAPGREPAYYNDLALRIANWSAPIMAVVLMFLVVWGFSRRRPERNAYGFGLAVFISYAAIDGGLGLAAGAPTDLLRLPFILGMTGGLAATLAAAALTRRAA